MWDDGEGEGIELMWDRWRFDGYLMDDLMDWCEEGWRRLGGWRRIKF